MTDMQSQIELANLRGEVRFLRTIVRMFLERELTTGGAEAKNRLQQALDAERSRLGKATPERVTFEHAHNEFNKGY